MQEVNESTVKNRSKLALDFKDRGGAFFKKLDEVLVKSNDKKFGEKIKALDIIEHLVMNMGTSEIKKIQESSLTKWDKINMAYEEYCQKNKVKIELEEFLAMKLKLH